MIRRTFLLNLKTFFARTSLMRRQVLSVLRVYDRLEQHTKGLVKQTNLRCVEGCGRCCDNPRVSAAAVEFLPLASDLWMKGQAQEALKLLEDADDKRCVFYKPDPLVEGKGRCGIYAYRPLICRLYGFAANRDKKQNLIFVGCPMIREEFPQAYEAAENLSDQKSPDVPSMSDYGAQMASIDPELGKKQVNINAAMKEALMKVGLLVGFKDK